MRKNTNEIVNFNAEVYDVELQKLNDNLDKFLHLEQCFEIITGSKEIKTLEYINTMVTALTGFPNVESSIKLLNFETAYNFIENNLNDINYSNIDKVAKKVSKTAIDELKESCTDRLSDTAQKDHEVLIKIAKLYNEITNKDALRSIVTYDRHSSYVINLHFLNQSDQLTRSKY